MTQPLDTALALAQANMQLGLQLAEGWRDIGQKLVDLNRRCVSEVADEARDALTKGAGSALSLKARHGCWQDFIDEAEVLHMRQFDQAETALNAWRGKVGKALRTDANLPFETFVNVWLEIAKLTTGARRPRGFPLPE